MNQLAPSLYSIKAINEDGVEVTLYLQIDHDYHLDSIGESERSVKNDGNTIIV